MSRIPQRGSPAPKSSLPLPSSNRASRSPSPNKASTLSSTSRPSGSGTRSAPRSPISPISTTRTRTQSTPKPPPRRADEDEPSSTPKGATSLREAIALKRAEAKKAATRPANASSSSDGAFLAIDETPVGAKSEEGEEVGRWNIRELIERARGNGNINLSLRNLPCIPSALFEIHLDVIPQPLVSVPEEPPIGASAALKSGKTDRTGPSWYESQDLFVLKAGGNAIVEVQPEISLFGSLKIVDLHNNKIVSLPSTFSDLSLMTSLDLSHNALTNLPTNFFALPNLLTLNLSHNALTTLPFSEPFNKSSPQLRKSIDGDLFGPPAPVRADRPLPLLQALDASFNKLTSGGIDPAWPSAVSKVDLSSNPLGAHAKVLIRTLSTLERLAELRLEEAEIADEALSQITTSPSVFRRLRLLSLAKTRVSREAAERAFTGREVNFDWVVDPPPAGEEGPLRILVGTQVVKEVWEIEAEKRVRGRKSAANLRSSSDEGGAAGGRAAPPVPKPPIEKEHWEWEAEQGLHTEGGRRRARLAAAGSSSSSTPPAQSDPTGLSVARPPSSSPSLPTASSLSNTTYYSDSTHTLTLPPSQPTARGHARAFSAAAGPMLRPSGSRADLGVPVPTLPLATIAAESLAQTLRVLVLKNRRADPSFTLPASCNVAGAASPLPRLEELNLDGCSLGDSVPVSTSDASHNAMNGRTSQPTLTLIARLFPSLCILSLSYNTFTSASFTTTILSQLLLADDATGRRGLTHLRLIGNRLADLDGFEALANEFKGNRQVPAWKLEELDLRENEIGRLPPKMGLLPLDVLLVDGNTFRVPARRVWEREGTRGLLSWLRGRLDEE